MVLVRAGAYIVEIFLLVSFGLSGRFSFSLY